MNKVNSQKNLTRIIKSKITSNQQFTLNNFELIEDLVHALANERTVHVIGGVGTGKSFLINSVIIPQLDTEYSIHRFNRSDLKSTELDSLLLDPNNKIVISTVETVVQLVGLTSQTQEINRIQNILDDCYEICLTNLQEQFLEYPSVIEKIVNDIHNVSMDQIQVSLVGYLESLISGIQSNFSGLRNIINSENIAEWCESLELYSPNVKFMLTFASYLDSKRKRENIWDSLYQGPKAVDLSKISDFNYRFKNSWGMAVADTGLAPKRKHTKVVDLMRLKKYCESLITKFIYNALDEESIDGLLKPIINNINGLQSGEIIVQTIIEDIYVFNKPETKIEITPQIKSIEDYNSLIIEIKKDDNYCLNFNFLLRNDGYSSKPISISANEASLLFYLAMERKMDEKDWLKHPEDHVNILTKISLAFEMTQNFDEEIQTKPWSMDQSKTWIWDFRNRSRKTYVKNINKNLNEIGEITGKLIHNIKSDTSRKGNYSLAKSIEHIELPSMK